MKNIPKKYTIKIPNDIIVLYCNKKKIMSIIGPLARKSLKLKVKILFESETNTLKVSSMPFTIISNKFFLIFETFTF